MSEHACPHACMPMVCIMVHTCCVKLLFSFTLVPGTKLRSPGLPSVHLFLLGCLEGRVLLSWVGYAKCKGVCLLLQCGLWHAPDHIALTNFSLAPSLRESCRTFRVGLCSSNKAPWNTSQACPEVYLLCEAKPSQTDSNGDLLQPVQATRCH